MGEVAVADEDLLERHHPAEPAIPRDPDPAHASARELATDLVVRRIARAQREIAGKLGSVPPPASTTGGSV